VGGEAPVTPVSSPDSSSWTFPTNRAITGTLVLLIYKCRVVSIVKYFILLTYLIILCYSLPHVLLECAGFPQGCWLEETLEGFPIKTHIHSFLLVWI
jgi:hypothetical protein